MVWEMVVLAATGWRKGWAKEGKVMDSMDGAAQAIINTTILEFETVVVEGVECWLAQQGKKIRPVQTMVWKMVVFVSREGLAGWLDGLVAG
jgi:hypothetical protein